MRLAFLFTCFNTLINLSENARILKKIQMSHLRFYDANRHSLKHFIALRPPFSPLLLVFMAPDWRINGTNVYLNAPKTQTSSADLLEILSRRGLKPDEWQQ